jgi:hypothetical protein
MNCEAEDQASRSFFDTAMPNATRMSKITSFFIGYPCGRRSVTQSVPYAPL